MIPRVESFILRTTEKDAYGKITTISDNIYWGMIERQTQFRVAGGATVVLGEGMVFTDEFTAVDQLGKEIIIDSNVYTIIQAFDAHDLTGYHHTEIIYG